MMQPILAELRQEFTGKLQVDFVDVWKNPAEGDKYRVQIIPTQVFFDRKGKEVFRHVGFFPKEQIIAKFKELGIDL
jgi:thioredoxin 1